MELKLVAVEVHDEVLFLPGGMISRWVYGVKSDLTFWLDREAPVNKRPNKTSGEPPPGHLHAMLYTDVDQRGKVFTIEAGSRAHYTKYVIHGTNTIYARGPGGQFRSAADGGGMYLPANPGYGRGRWRQRVRGQEANNFLGRAYDMTARTHPALKGISME